MSAFGRFVKTVTSAPGRAVKSVFGPSGRSLARRMTRDELRAQLAGAPERIVSLGEVLDLMAREAPLGLARSARRFRGIMAGEVTREIMSRSIQAWTDAPFDSLNSHVHDAARSSRPVILVPASALVPVIDALEAGDMAAHALNSMKRHFLVALAGVRDRAGDTEKSTMQPIIVHAGGPAPSLAGHFVRSNRPT